MSETKLYSIGNFAKMSNVSSKQLRYLEEKGLFLPQMRNIDNNYRYYSHKQMEKLIFINTLRNLGMPFESVVKILEAQDSDAGVNILRGYLDSVNGEIQKLLSLYQMTAFHITQIMEGNQIINDIRNSGGKQNCSEIKIIEIPKQTVLYTRYEMNVAAEDLFVERYFELKKKAENRNIAISKGMCAVFHDGYMKQYNNEKADLETFIPVQDGLKESECIRHIECFKGVSCIYIGHYGSMKECYLAMEEWAAKRSIALMDASVEKYIMGPDNSIHEEDYVTEIIIPLEGSRLGDVVK